MSSTRIQARSEMGLNVIRLLAFGMLLIFPAASEAQSPPIAEQIAKTYGLDCLGKSRQFATPGMRNFPGPNCLTCVNGTEDRHGLL